MSSAIMSLLISHILTFVESELAKEEPEMVQALVQDVQSLVAKLESLIASKSSTAAKIATPVLNAVSTATIAGLETAGASLAQDAQSS